MAQPQIEFMVGPEAASTTKPTHNWTLEVTQAIGDLNASVLLISGKRTFVRAYLGQPSDVVKVRGWVSIGGAPPPAQTLRQDAPKRAVPASTFAVLPHPTPMITGPVGRAARGLAPRLHDQTR